MIILDNLLLDSTIKTKIKTLTATATLLITDPIVVINNAAVNVSYNLPVTTGNEGVEIVIMRISGSTGTITINAPAGSTVEGIGGTLGATSGVAGSGTRGSKICFICVGNSWLRKWNG